MSIDVQETWRGMQSVVPFGFDSSRSVHSYLVSTSSSVRSDSLIRVPDSCEDRESSEVCCGVDYAHSVVSRSVQTDEVPLDEGERIRFAANLKTLDTQLEELIKVYEVKLKARPRRRTEKLSSEESSLNDEAVEHQGSLRNTKQMDEIHDRRSVASTVLRERVELLKAEIRELRRKHDVLERKFSHTVQANKHRVELVDLEMKEMKRRLDELSKPEEGNGVVNRSAGETDCCDIDNTILHETGGGGGGGGGAGGEKWGQLPAVKTDDGGASSRRKPPQKGSRRKQQGVLNPQTCERKPQWK
ncbi:hypothetical protein BSKO_14110 [Bryopsis sp. KO-2023]|nr:hypothetical protein BSKO_14110 [Bryopsis sp. KO-2023]